VQRVGRLPEVREVSSYLFTALRPAGTDLVPGLQLTGVTPVEDRALVTMDQPRYRAGRPPRPDRPDEIAVNSSVADHLHVRVGQVITVEAFRQDQVNDLFSETTPPAPDGARIRATVTGIADPLDAFASRQSQNDFGIIMTTRAAWDRYGAKPPLDFTGDDVPASDLGLFRLVLRARLVHGAADAPRYLRHVFEIFDGKVETTFSEARPDLFGTAGDSVRVQSIALLLFALAAALAGVMAVSQTGARHVANAITEDDAPLHALGLERRSRVLAASVPIVIGVLAGALVAVAGATFASRWMPRGLARRFEPHPGVRFDAVVVAGAALLAVAVIARILTAAWLGTRGTGATRRSGRVTRLTAPLPPPVAMGAGMAASRPTVLAGVAAVAGVVATLTFAAALNRLAAHPELSGEPWHTEVVLQTEGKDIAAREAPRLVADRSVAGLSRYSLIEASLGRADKRATGMAIERLKGEVAPTLLTGRLPGGPDEIALDAGAVPGPGPEIGRTVAVQAGDDAVPMRVVGHLTGTGEGFVVTSDALERLGAEPSDSGFLLQWKRGTDVAAATARLRKTFPEVEPPVTPNRVANLREARGFPYALAVFLALLGLLAAAHLLVTTVRRRRVDLAVVRALGFTPGQARAVAAWQATAVAVVAVVLGVPIGIAIGRWAWTAITNALRVVDQSPTPLAAVLATVVAAVVVVNLLALGPGRRAARIRPAEVLRAE
jgi:hypothetical protein